MSLNNLTRNSLKLILFGGKGGVGKTTCAASAGVYLSSEGLKVLLISTDPAHSLSDSFTQEIGGKIKEIRGAANLKALEVNAEKALTEFKLEYEEEIKKILDTSTYLDQEDIDSVLTLPIPGIDEVMSFKKIVDLIEEAKFDKYVIDTAPTGHALRLLTLPGLLDEWIKVMAKMRWKYRYMIESFGGAYKSDEGDDFLISMKKTVKKIEGILKDSQKCEFVAVTIPEDMAILETERLVNDLNKYGIKAKHLVINNVLKSEGCEFCRERKKEQEKYIGRIKKKFENSNITIAPLFAREVKGLDSLNEFSKFLF